MTRPQPARWEVWFANLNPTVGNEQAGDRPVVIVSSDFHLRLAPTLVTVVPLTSRERPGLLHRVPVETDGATGYVITEQIRTISRQRLRRRVGPLDPKAAAEVAAVLSRMIDV